MVIIVLAIVGGLIGYITNVLAIKLLFRPIIPTRIFGIQGVIPKRHREIASSIGEIIEDELVSMDDIANEITSKMDKKQVLEMIKKKLLILLQTKFPMFVMFQAKVQPAIDNIFETEGEKMLDDLIDKMLEKVTGTVSINKIVETKILELNLEKMEEIIIKIAKKELKHIEYLGGLLGFGIGVLQGLIVVFFLK